MPALKNTTVIARIEDLFYGLAPTDQVAVMKSLETIQRLCKLGVGKPEKQQAPAPPTPEAGTMRDPETGVAIKFVQEFTPNGTV